MSSLALARKWRPHTFDAVAGQKHVVTALTQALNTQRLHHAYLFTGTRGVGKTTIARIFAKALNCEKGISATPCGECVNCQDIDAGRFPDFIEIDAASRSKVEDTRDILDNILYAPVRGRYKVYLIDEIHMLSNHSFNALLKTLEEPPEHVMFLLATTDPKKLPVTVLSRCLQFHLKNMLPHEIITHLTFILEQEKITWDLPVLPWVAQAADGSLRDALSIVDQAIAYSPSHHLSENHIREMLGYVETQQIIYLVEALATKDAEKVLAICYELQQQGTHCHYILQELQCFFHKMTVFQCVPSYALSDSDTFLLSTTAMAMASQITPEDLQLFYQIALKGLPDLALAPTPWIALEMTLLRMMIFQPVNENKNRETITTIPIAEEKCIVETTDESLAINVSTNWDTLLPRLNLSGLAQIMAKHCALQECAPERIVLNVPTQHAASLTNSIKQQIDQALKEHFKSLNTVIFELSDQKLHSPAQKQQDKQDEATQQATSTLNNDPKFQKILHTFHGTIIPDSITNHNQITEV